MKTCPYCAEEIQDAAIKCRYCQSWLVDEVPAAAVTPPAGMGQEPAATLPESEPQPEGGATSASGSAQTDTLAVTVPDPSSPSATAPGAEAAATETTPGQKVEFTHSGERYLLGYTDEFFGIWDRQSPDEPSERFPRTDAGWSRIWQRYVGLESNWMDLRTGQRSP